MVVQTPYCAPDLEPICESISMPIDDNIDIESLKIEIENGIKKLVINSYSEFKVKAIVPGEITEDFQEGIGLVLKLNLFREVPTDLDAQAFFEECNIDSWRYENWIQAYRIPKTIIYENVQPSVGITPMDVSAGDEIGTANQIKLSIEYSDSLSDNPRFMHPREFFSLLFWQEDYDPIFTNDESIIAAIESSDYSLIDFSNDPSSPYSHSLVQKMMVTKEDGTPGTFEDNDWLGLRPPLRTYQRVKWEAWKEHLIPNYTSYWDAPGRVFERIKNPYMYQKEGSYQVGVTYCNIFVGEILFRAGFKTIVHSGGLCSGQKKLQNRLKYRGPTQLCNQSLTTSGYIKYDSETICNQVLGSNARPTNATHEQSGSFAEKINCDKENINNYIQCGHVFILAKKGSPDHVVLIDEVLNCSPPRVKALDQWHNLNGKVWSRDNYYHPYPPRNTPAENIAILKILPGGDPTEERGILDLNCLKEVQQDA